MNATMNRKKTILKAAVLLNGRSIVCPVCSGGKTSRAKTCLECCREEGPEARAAIEAAITAVEDAVEGHKKSLATSEVARNVVFGGVLCNFRLHKQVKEVKGSQVGDYMEVNIPVPGGAMTLFVFGATKDDLGKQVTGIFDLKTKTIRPGKSNQAEIHYGRLQVVRGATSDANLAVARIEDVASFTGALPRKQIVDEATRHYVVGFKAA